MKSASKLIKALKFISETLDKKDVPLYWVTLVLTVYEAGDKGVTTKEAAEDIDMTQGIASRTVKLLSRYIDASGNLVRFDLLVAMQNDLHHRHRQRIYLTEHGKNVVEAMLRIMEK